MNLLNEVRVEALKCLFSGNVNEEKFVEIIKEINKSVDSLASLEREAKKNRISQYPYKKGDKVRVVLETLDGKTTEPIPAYISAVGVHDDGSLFPQLHKARKDGTESNFRLYVYQDGYNGIRSIETWEETK